MKKTLLLIPCILGLSYSAFAGACITDTLADYITDGSCTIGTDLTFSGFNYVASGSVHIPASDVEVTPITVGGEIGFLFNAPWFALPGAELDSSITYTATCDTGNCLNDWELDIGGVSLPPTDAFISVGETAPQVPGELSVGAFSGSTTLSDAAMFPPVNSISVSKDLIVYGGSTTAGGIIAHVSSLTNLFSTSTTSMVPEPSSLILCVGLLAFIPIARRKFVR